jgi:hypothetical protein
VDERGWSWFLLWALPGLALGLQVSAIGILVAPLGLLAVWLLVRATGLSAEALGLALGVAAVFALVAALNAGPGDFDAGRWAVAAAVVGLGGTGAYAIARAHRGR